MNSFRMRITTVITLLLLTLFVGCQVAPLTSAGGDKQAPLNSVDIKGRTTFANEVIVNFVNKTGKGIVSVHCIKDGVLKVEQFYSPAVVANGIFYAQLPVGNYQFFFFDAPYTNGMQPTGFIGNTQITAAATLEIEPINGGPTDPPEQVTVCFINKTGTSIGELRYRQAAVAGDEEQVAVFNPTIANNGQFTLTMPAGRYSFVVFEQAGNPVNPIALADNRSVAEGVTIELTASTGGPPEMVDITFLNISGRTLNALYWRYAGDSSAPYVRIPISPASVNNSSFNLSFPNGLYDLQFCYESGGNVEVVVELQPVPLSPQSNYIHIVNSTPPPGNF